MSTALSGICKRCFYLLDCAMGEAEHSQISEIEDGEVVKCDGFSPAIHSSKPSKKNRIEEELRVTKIALEAERGYKGLAEMYKEALASNDKELEAERLLRKLAVKLLKEWWDSSSLGLGSGEYLAWYESFTQRVKEMLDDL